MLEPFSLGIFLNLLNVGIDNIPLIIPKTNINTVTNKLICSANGCLLKAVPGQI
jgi:hypothetical protein